MTGRVLATPEAKSAITQIQSIINGGLADQIQALDVQGKKLSDPNVWDGPLAIKFRSDTWPPTNTALQKAKADLDDLQKQLATISQNIMSAGGGA